MSRVFVADETRFGRRVVIKVLTPELAAGLSAERFEREIGLAAGLQEPHIVPVITAGQTAAGLPYYTMPYVDGESLRARMQHGPIPVGDAIRILDDVARALAYAHARGIVHRDIKPENVLLSSGTAVVTDFGIAKAVKASKTTAPGGTLTQVGTSLGTPAYMAPEQAVGDDVDHRADIYAWGIMAFEMLAGRHPFGTKATSQQIIAAHIAEAPPPLEVPGLRAMDPLPALIMRCLAKSPSVRPANAEELIRVLDGARTTGPNTSAFGRRRAMPTAIAAGAMLLVIVGIASMKMRAQRGGAATIAVLPFEHRGPPEQASFTEGLADAVTGKLIGVPGLTVIDHRSAVTYKGSSKSPSQIGSELGVAYVLEGVVSWARDASGGWRAQVRPTLVRTRDGIAQWAGEPLIVTPTDPFSAQAEIATSVVSAIGVAIGTKERATLGTAPTKNSEAYEDYMRAVALYNAHIGSLAEWKQNVAEQKRLLTRATQLDPTFAMAFARMARVEYSATNFDTTALARMEAALKTALAIDPEQPEAHFVRGEYLWFDETRLPEALAETARANAREPGNAEILTFLGTLEIHAGQVEEGFAKVERGTVLDPRSMGVLANTGFFDWHFRRFDDLERHARQMVALDPAEPVGYYMLTELALARGDTASAARLMAESDRVTKEPGGDAMAVFWELPLSLTIARATPKSIAPTPVSLTGSDSLWRWTIAGAWFRESGQVQRARENFDSALTAFGPPLTSLKHRSIAVVGQAGRRAIALAGAGRSADARQMITYADSIERLNALPNNPEMAEAQSLIAYALLVLGDRDAAIARLGHALALPSGLTPETLGFMWPFASLRTDAGFRRLVAAGERRTSE